MTAKRTIILVLLLVFGGVVTTNAQSERVSVRVSQERPSVLGRFSVKFVSVIEDSRCPVGTVCVWAGNAKIKVQISKKGGETKEFELNTNLKPQTAAYKGYEIRIISLSPRPGEMTKAMAAKHTAVLEITRTKH